MSRADFDHLLQELTGAISARALDASLQQDLNDSYGAGSDWFASLSDACRAGIREGWLCQHEHGGIRFGRVIKPGPELQGFSVDVVEMDDIIGPHHRHPNGEIDMVIPETESAEFDGHGAGWVVYGPDSAHKPTVTGGRAIVLYLLPDGEIEFS